MTKLQIISFPRSGHHWLMNMTQRALDLPTGWHCDLHNSAPHFDTIVEKTHDFSLDFVPKPDCKVIIQWRDPIDAICSWYEFGVKRGNWISSEKHFRFFAAAQIVFAAQFYDRWVAPESHTVIEYDNLRRAPESYLRDVIEIIGGTSYNSVDLSTVPARYVQSFKYYDYEFFKSLGYSFKKLIA